MPSVSQNPGCQAVLVRCGHRPDRGHALPVRRRHASASTRQPGTTGNGTIINCNGHTVYASHGGTFASVINASGVTVENCYLSNFTTAIYSSAPYATVINDTVLNSGTAVHDLGLQVREGLGQQDAERHPRHRGCEHHLGHNTEQPVLRDRQRDQHLGRIGRTLTNNTASLGAYGMADAQHDVRDDPEQPGADHERERHVLHWRIGRRTSGQNRRQRRQAVLQQPQLHLGHLLPPVPAALGEGSERILL